jgi:D-serine deaminase-like pyridoxal phosphate-dependent protein
VRSSFLRKKAEMLFELPDEVDTPMLVVNPETMLANIDRMATELATRNVALRPHAKTHKCPEIARLQVSHGAIGLTVATLGEAEEFAAHGFEDLFIAYPLFVQGGKADRLRHLTERIRLRIGVDSELSAQALAHSVGQAGIGVMIEIDSGQHRSGVRPEQAGDLGAHCASLGLEVDGVFTHGGHGYLPGSAAAAGADESNSLRLAADSLAGVGLSCSVQSAGSTPTALSSATGSVTEERPGTYVFNDAQQLKLGVARPEDLAVVIAATVVSTAVPGQVVIDAGSKALSSDRAGFLPGYGMVPELGGAFVTSLSECHGVVHLTDVAPPTVGSLVRVVPNHVCSAVNLFDSFGVVSNGHLIDQWPITARGHLS